MNVEAVRASLIYTEALLVDSKLADQVWEAWDKGEIDDMTAWLAWWLQAAKYETWSHSSRDVSAIMIL